MGKCSKYKEMAQHWRDKANHYRQNADKDTIVSSIERGLTDDYLQELIWHVQQRVKKVADVQFSEHGMDFKTADGTMRIDPRATIFEVPIEELLQAASTGKPLSLISRQEALKFIETLKELDRRRNDLTQSFSRIDELAQCWRGMNDNMRRSRLDLGTKNLARAFAAYENIVNAIIPHAPDADRLHVELDYMRNKHDLIRQYAAVFFEGKSDGRELARVFAELPVNIEFGSVLEQIDFGGKTAKYDKERIARLVHKRMMAMRERGEREHGMQKRAATQVQAQDGITYLDTETIARYYREVIKSGNLMMEKTDEPVHPF